jgi:3-phenylpropionate/trans-cinnamate dioxygenase ferredoxin reductase subunit
MAFVIVGGGHAAAQTAASLRQEGYEGELIIIGEESHIPYQRPPLSKQYLAGEYGIERVYLRPQKFYEDRDIDVRAGIRVENIDTPTKTLILEDNSTLKYDKLLLATGARARQLDIPGVDLDGIHYLRTLADVDQIKFEMAANKRLTIVGGGYIGLEVAAIAIKAGLEVTILEMEERILHRVTTPQMSEFYYKLHVGAGVKIRTGAAATRFIGDHSVSKIECADGSEIDSDIAIIGAGVIPNVELASDAGLKCDNGIIVNERCVTSSSDIYAAGDCTNHPNALLDRRLRLESVPNAMEQSRVAAANMLDKTKEYASIPWFWSDQYDLKLQMVGFSSDGNSQVMRGDPDTRCFSVFYFNDDMLVAADSVNSAKDFLTCKQLIGNKVDPGKLVDPSVDLKTLIQP